MSVELTISSVFLGLDYADSPSTREYSYRRYPESARSLSLQGVKPGNER